jgi:hypothetical protein
MTFETPWYVNYQVYTSCILTQTLKVKRRIVLKKYQDMINAQYQVK